VGRFVHVRRFIDAWFVYAWFVDAWFVVVCTGAEEGLVGDHQVHLERNVASGVLSGDPLDEGVGHDLPAGASL
jgi:hypothetical protein